MEDRTQIKFNNPDIDGSPRPQLVTLEEENPVEGKSKRDDGTEFVWHKWLCTGNQYFMASPSLDGMLKMIPDKAGKVIKIEKVPNPKGFPFFQINGKNRDEIVSMANANNLQTDTVDVATPTTEGAFDRLEKKLDTIIELLNKTKSEKEALPF